MASTEELEAQILAEMESNPEAYADTGTEYCTVDDDTRLVTIPEKYKKLGVESDEKAKRIWFRFPKLVGNNAIDLSAIGVRVNFRNANGDGDIYIVEDLTADGDYVTFSWELTRKVTAYKGHVSFVVCAVKSATDGTTKNEWNTTLNKECEVLEGLEVSEQIAQENPDIIEYILANLGGSVSAEEIATAVEEYMAKNPQKDVSYEPQELTEEQKAQARKNIDAEASGTAESKVSAHNTATDAHNDIRLLIEGLTTRLNALADSDDTTLDQMSEVVAYIKSNKSLIDAIMTSKISVSDIIDNLTTNVSNKPLSAAQGVALKALIDGIVIPTKLSELENDSGYAKTTDIPDKLPNPQKLTFAGAVTAEYDGSKPVSVEIPSGGGSTSGNSKYSLISEVVTEELLNRIVIEIPSNINELFAYVKVPASSDKKAIYATAWSNDTALFGNAGEVGIDTLDTNECYIKMHFLKLGNYRLCDYASKAYYSPVSNKFYAGGKVGEITGNYYIFGIQYTNIAIPVGVEIKLYGR